MLLLTELRRGIVDGYKHATTNGAKRKKPYVIYEELKTEKSRRDITPGICGWSRLHYGGVDDRASPCVRWSRLRRA
jgi:hypothetical protein